MEGYKILSIAGEGSYGVVMKAREIATGALVAIKQFKGEEDESSIRELQILSLMNHPNIVRMVSYGDPVSYLGLSDCESDVAPLHRQLHNKKESNIPSISEASHCVRVH